jgi:hypothetical protein
MTMLNEKKSAVSQSKHRRLSGRAIDVLERHKDDSVSIAAFEGSLPLAVDGYVTRYEQKIAIENENERLIAAAIFALGNLDEAGQNWVAILKKDLVNFEVEQFSSHSFVPDDVMNVAQRIIDLVKSYQESTENKLSYGSMLIEDMTTLLQTAKTAWKQVQEGKTALQELQSQTRAAAENLEKELVAFRRVLRRVLGSKHRDYQILRRDRGKDIEVEDEAADVAQTDADKSAQSEASRFVVAA